MTQKRVEWEGKEAGERGFHGKNESRKSSIFLPVD